MRRKFTFLPVWVFLAFSFPAFSQNTAIQFNGTDNFVSTAHDVVPTGGDGFTVEFWAFVAALPNDGIAHEFMSQGDLGSGFGFFIGYDGTTGVLQAGDKWTNVNNVVMPLGQWVHLALLFDANFDSAAFYINGIEVAFAPDYGISTGASHFQLGVQTTGLGKFNGKMDQVKIWQVLRTPQQIKADMYGPVDLTDPHLVAEYAMDEGSGTDVKNSATAAAGLDGLLQGTVGPTTTWVPSPIQFGDNALAFDGLHDNKVVIPNSGLFDLTGGTVEFWVFPTSLSATSTVLGNRGTSGIRYSFDISSTQIVMDNGSGSASSPISYNLLLNTWSHLAFVNDAGLTTVYVNGVLAGTIPGNFGSAVHEPVTIGAAKDLSGPDIQQFAGAVDEVRIWSTPRSQGEISTFMNNTMTGSELNLAGLFSFNQGVAGGDNTGVITAIDNTLNNNHGTLTNLSMSGTSSNFAMDNNLTVISLPLTLTKFTANRQGNEALLQWQTGQEENTSHFNVERSADGSQFTTIGTVAAAGNSNRPLNYNFTDGTPGKNANYYRLKEADLDGHFTYSPVKLLVFQTTGRLVWYVTGNKTVQVNLQQGSNERYTLTDLNGHTLREGQLSGGKTDISGYPAGLYVIKVMTTSGQIMNSKILLP